MVWKKRNASGCFQSSRHPCFLSQLPLQKEDKHEAFSVKVSHIHNFHIFGYFILGLPFPLPDTTNKRNGLGAEAPSLRRKQ